MGIFNFLKSRSKDTPAPPRPKPGRVECDISKTQVIANLLQTPREQREQNWQRSFLDNVLTASFAAGNPQIYTGPDGFPYFNLLIPEAYKPFESFCINNLKDSFLLANGVGVAINAQTTGADWVFSYGDIVNLVLNNEFYSNKNTVDVEKEETVKANEKILIAQPSKTFLPAQTRKALKNFLQTTGVRQPKVMMISREIKGQMIQELSFNVFRDDFPSQDALQHRLQQISWFLPRHYIVLSVDKASAYNNHLAEL